MAAWWRELTFLSTFDNWLEYIYISKAEANCISPAPPLSSPLVNGLTLSRLPAVFALPELSQDLCNVELTLWT